MQAIILAAGMGKRLKELTQDNTKCMVKVDGISLIERALGQLECYTFWIRRTCRGFARDAGACGQV